MENIFGSEVDTVLVIGNGFDLAHKLATSYEDFLDFVLKSKRVLDNLEREHIGYEYSVKDNSRCLSKGSRAGINRIIREGVRERVTFGNRHYDHLNKVIYGREFITEVNAELYYNVLKNLKDNTFHCWYGEHYSTNPWLQFFLDKYKAIKESDNDHEYMREIIGWSGFEGEIKAIVRKMTDRYVGGTFIRDENSVSAYEFLKKLDDDWTENEESVRNEYTDRTRIIKYELELALQQLIVAIEIYLFYFVPFWEWNENKVDFFESNHFNTVVNFNYTDTYFRKYGRGLSNERCFFIHGKADERCKGNLVLGIDEFLQDDDRARQADFIEYRKFYQRLFKKTDYVKIKDYFKGEKKHIAVFYGHSMSELDKEVLMDFLPINENGRICAAIIGAYDIDSQKKQILELVRMLGMNKLTELMSGSNPRIEVVLNEELENRYGIKFFAENLKAANSKN